MQSSGGVADAGGRGAGRRVERPLRPRRRRGRRRPARPRLAATATRSASTWAGTSCDVCVVEDGQVRRTDSREIDGRVIQLPMVDVHTVGAGGGSIGWRDAGGALRVGPRSAGADPGPACYGRGGTEPTVTDANLLLGVPRRGLDACRRGRPRRRRRRHGGRPRWPPRSASASWRPPRGSSGSPTRRWCGRCAWSPSSAASTHAASPCFRSAAPGRCTRPRSPPSSRSSRILCPRAGGVLSALGLCASDRRRDTTRTVMLSGET